MKRSLGSVTALAALGAWLSLGQWIAGCSAEGTNASAADDSADAQEVPQADAAPLETDASSTVAPPDCADCAFFLPTCEPQSFCPVDLTALGTAGTVKFNDMSGTSEKDVWVLGAKGTIVHYDGAVWAKVNGPTVAGLQIMSRSDGEVWTAYTLKDLYVHAPGGADAGADGGGDGGTDSEWGQATFTPALSGLNSNAYAPVNEMWSAAGASWSWLSIRDDDTSEMPNSTSFHLRRTRKSDGAYVLDEPFYCTIVPYDTENCPMFMGIHGTKDDVWAVGEAGVAYRILAADSDWPSLAVYDSRTYATLHGVWSGEYGDVWAVGSQGTIRHYAGSDERRFEFVTSPVTTTLRSIGGSSPTDIWAVGDGGVVLHYDGTTWSRVPLGGVAGKPDLFAVWAASPSRVWAAGDGVIVELSASGGT